MVSDWQDVPISQVASIYLGGTPSRSASEYWDGGIKWATAKDVANCTSRYIRDTSETISASGLNNSAAKILGKDTTVITARGTVGAVCMLAEAMAFNQTCYGLVAKQGTNPTYLYYGLKASLSEIGAISYGTVFNTITMRSFDVLRIPHPPLPKQRAIAHILGTLDDKIELNRQMNQTLEAMAQALFKSWFVDFEPFRDKGMQDSAPGKIPVGWRVGTLGDVANNLRRGVQADQIEGQTPYIGLEHMPRHCITLTEWGKANNIQSNKFKFKRGEILFGKLRPYFHKVGIAPVDGVCSTDILVVTPKEHGWFGLVLGYISSDEFINYTDAASTGTKMPRTNWDHMASYRIVLPPGDVAEAFTGRVDPLFERIIVNIIESRTLAEIRDSLLPKVLSGEIRVKDAGEFVEMKI